MSVVHCTITSMLPVNIDAPLQYSPATHCLDVLDEVLEDRCGGERVKHLPLVEEGVHEVRIAVQCVSQTGVEDLQQHLKDLLQCANVSCLYKNKRGKFSWQKHMCRDKSSDMTIISKFTHTRVHVHVFTGSPHQLGHLMWVWLGAWPLQWVWLVPQQ